MNILLTNDDGINAPGLSALASVVSKLGDIIIVAPATEMSAVGHAITISDPLRVSEVARNGEFFGYAVNGTPADCVKIAYWALLKDKPKPDLLISGINLGSNTGINTIYSGTVSAATEGAILSIPSFAISLATYTNPDFSYAADFAGKLVTSGLLNKLPKGVFLNVNVPAVPSHLVKGVRVTRQGLALFEESYQVRQDPRNRNYYWLSGEKKEVSKNLEDDDSAIADNYVSLTPIHFDLTCYAVLEKIKGFTIDKTTASL
jgi:5'-nucleotidase